MYLHGNKLFDLTVFLPNQRAVVPLYAFAKGFSWFGCLKAKFWERCPPRALFCSFNLDVDIYK
jgi:hypothetical protein